MTLTPREVEVLGFVASGKTQASIAKILSISYHSVNYYLDSAKSKLEAENTPNAVAIAIRKNIIA